MTYLADIRIYHFLLANWITYWNIPLSTLLTLEQYMFDHLTLLSGSHACFWKIALDLKKFKKYDLQHIHLGPYHNNYSPMCNSARCPTHDSRRCVLWLLYISPWRSYSSAKRSRVTRYSICVGTTELRKNIFLKFHFNYLLYNGFSLSEACKANRGIKDI